MSRLFVYDENMADERAKITLAKMAAISDIVAPQKDYIQYSATGELVVLPGCVCSTLVHLIDLLVYPLDTFTTNALAWAYLSVL